MLCYDFLRIHRRINSVPNFVVNIEDFIFAAFSAVAVFYTTYVKNNGEIRWQTAAGLFLGCGLYMFIIRDRFVKLICVIWRAAIKFLIKLLKIVIFPMVFILKIITKPARVICWYSGKGIKRVGRRAKIKGAKARIKLKHMGYIMRKK